MDAGYSAADAAAMLPLHALPRASASMEKGDCVAMVSDY